MMKPRQASTEWRLAETAPDKLILFLADKPDKLLSFSIVGKNLPKWGVYTQLVKSINEKLNIFW